MRQQSNVVGQWMLLGLVIAGLFGCLPISGIVAYRLYMLPEDTFNAVLMLVLGAGMFAVFAIILFHIFSRMQQTASNNANVQQMQRDNLDLLRDVALIKQRQLQNGGGLQVLPASEPNYEVFDVDTRQLDRLLTDGGQD